MNNWYLPLTLIAILCVCMLSVSCAIRKYDQFGTIESISRCMMLLVALGITQIAFLQLFTPIYLALIGTMISLGSPKIVASLALVAVVGSWVLFVTFLTKMILAKRSN